MTRDECLRMARDCWTTGALMTMVGTAYDAGRAAGIEEAAKVADYAGRDGQTYMEGMDQVHEQRLASAHAIARAIRALAQPSGERTA